MDYYQPMDCPGSGCTWKNETESKKHFEYVANVVSILNPDIINFCEVEGCDELNLLNSMLPNNTKYVPYLKKGTDTSTGQNVGMLTLIDPVKSLYRSELKHNYPVVDSTCGYTGSPGSSGVSKHYITEFSFNGLNVAFIAAHLLAIPDDINRCTQREAQASVLQNVIFNFIQNEYEIIMLGDFNDYDAEILDVNNNKPLSIVLDILKGLKGELGGKYQLNNIAQFIQQKQRYSDWWDSDNNCNTSSNKDFSMIDHILVTDAVQKYISDVFIYHDYSEFCGKYDSDHYPVVVDFLF
jgi:exonuclease III